MDQKRNELLAEISRDAALERSDFLVRAGEQMERFLKDQASRLTAMGGMTLIDDDPDYLAIAPDGTFRSRTRIYDEATGEWQSETEVIETGGELVELYNPADIYAAFADAARDGVWEDETGDPASDSGPTMQIDGADPYAAAADRWAAGQPELAATDRETSAPAALYELALDFQERSQRAESGLIEQFENAASALMGKVGSVVIVDAVDEHLELGLPGFTGRVVREGDSGWTELEGPESIVRFYDPTDVFGDLADAIAEAFPGVADDADADSEGELDDSDGDLDDADGDLDDAPEA